MELAVFPFLFLARGHRVLLFSQMTQMLDILQDYLDYRGDIPWPFITLLRTFRLNSPDGPVKTYLGCGDVTENNSVRILFRIKGR